jgi:phage terminase Nu1 subunit (DNA packaging protein)
MSDAATPSVPVGTLARLLNLTEVRIQQLAKQGVVVKGGRGRYDLWNSIKGYVRYLQERNVGRPGSGLSATEAGEVVGEDYQKHRARLYKAKADSAELEASLLRGRLHDAEAVRKVTEDMISSARAKLLGVKRKAAGKVIGLTDLAAVEAAIEEPIIEALNELTNYDPSRFTKQAIQDNQPEVEAPDEADGEPMG